LGELEGPVRAIRETWGADSGTNVTKTETFYRDAITYRYRVRVHPIPPDGLYTSWDYNHDVAATYYNETKTEGVAIDGVNDDIGQVDSLPNGEPAFFDAPDPTFTKPLAFLNWEQVSGRGDAGSLVYIFEMKNAQSLGNPTVVPYYRDDACLDDGTGDDPSPRPMPGEAYSSSWGSQEAEKDRPCFTEAPEGYTGPYKQGAFGSHGVHYFFTGDTDNAFSPAKVTEIDGQQWQFAVPTAEPTNVGDPYANTVKTPLVPLAIPQTNVPAEGPDIEPEEPAATTLAVTGPRAGLIGQVTTLEATLTAEGAGVEGADVLFYEGSSFLGAASTNASGVARLPFEFEGPKRQSTLTTVFEGTDDFVASSDSVPFEVKPKGKTKG
jgi:hypothetical protein